jgi:hypothetical protein
MRVEVVHVLRLTDSPRHTLWRPPYTRIYRTPTGTVHDSGLPEAALVSHNAVLGSK